MSGVAISAGLPCGAWREHTRKFSPQWFLAVHATIPFVAMLRKAVLMPRWAILLTVLGSGALQGRTGGMGRGGNCLGGGLPGWVGVLAVEGWGPAKALMVAHAACCSCPIADTFPPLSSPCCSRGSGRGRTHGA